jgi:hypothetical protein
MVMIANPSNDNILLDQVSQFQQVRKCKPDLAIGMASQQLTEPAQREHHVKGVVAPDEQAGPIVTELYSARFNSSRVWRGRKLPCLLAC